MSAKKTQIPVLLLVLVPLSIWLIFIGFKNERDAVWDSLDSHLKKDFITLDKVADSLQILYARFQGIDLVSDSTAIKRVSDAYLPTMEFEKFNEYFNTIVNNKKTVIAGVSGSGNSTIADRICNLIATKQENKLLVQCAPQFDLEFNKKYIGYYEKNVFYKGELLKFWDKCLKNPKEKFICLIDNFDKINPETFFGPELWEKLSDDKTKVIFGKDTVNIPKNFYLVSVTHLGAGQKVEMNDEQFKRIGKQVVLPPNANELILYLKDKKKEVIADLKKYGNTPPQLEKDKKDYEKLTEQLAALNDTFSLKRMLYFFIKTNDLIENKYAAGYQLGQWSDLRKQFRPKDFETLQSIFINHILSFKNTTDIKKEDFKNILYTINTDGEIYRSSPIWKWGNTLTDLGFASELGVAGSFALISALVGWLYFRRRKKHISEYTGRVYALMADFNKNKMGYDEMVGRMNAIKNEFDGLVLDQKINYDEAAFFYGFLEDKTRTLEIAREINESFLKLVDAFLEDKILTESEYQKLNQFLESIKYKISTGQYLLYKEEIEKIHKKYGQAI